MLVEVHPYGRCAVYDVGLWTLRPLDTLDIGSRHAQDSRVDLGRDGSRFFLRIRIRPRPRYRGRTGRRCNGIHQCANVVTGPLGSGQAVLIRAVEPNEGIDAMRRRRVGRPDADLANGPGKLCQALGIGAHHDGADLLDGPVAIVDDGQPPPLVPRSGPRVGMTKGIETPWRFRVPAVSSPRLHRQ